MKNLKAQYIVVGTTIENKVGDTIITANTMEELMIMAKEWGLLK